MDANAAQSKKRILIVEDEEDSRDVLVKLLDSAGKYEVSSASDGTDALAKLEAEMGKYDMVLLDIVMPRMDGIETLRQLKSEPAKYGTPMVLMLTNLGGDIAIETAINLGAQGYLMKIETEPAQLLKRVEEEFLKGPSAAPAQPAATPAPAPQGEPAAPTPAPSEPQTPAAPAMPTAA